MKCKCMVIRLLLFNSFVRSILLCGNTSFPAGIMDAEWTAGGEICYIWERLWLLYLVLVQVFKALIVLIRMQGFLSSIFHQAVSHIKHTIHPLPFGVSEMAVSNNGKGPTFRWVPR